jgi:hypothetical protein
MFAPTSASAQVNIYVGPGGYAHYGYGYGYPHYGYGYGYRPYGYRYYGGYPGGYYGPRTPGGAPRLPSALSLGLVIASLRRERVPTTGSNK